MRNQRRRTVLASIGLIATTGAVGSASGVGETLSQTGTSPGVEDTDWPTHRGTAARTGRTVEAAAPNGEYALEAWSLDETYMDMVDETIIAGGRVFRTSLESYSPFKGTVSAYDEATGEHLWTHDTLDHDEATMEDPAIGLIRGAPVVGDGRLYVSSSASYNQFGGLHALDVETGETVWKRTEEGYGTLAFIEGVLCSTATGYDPATGDVLWDDPTGRLLGFASENRYGVRKNELHVQDVHSGADQKVTTLEEVPSTTPTIENETAYWAGDAVHAVSLSGGTEQWRWSLPEETASWHLSDTLAVSDGTIVVTANKPIDEPEAVEAYPRGTHTAVYALDAATGAVTWTYDTPTRIEGDPTIAGDTVYLGGHAWGDKKRDYDGEAPIVWRRYPTIETLALSDGSERWSYLVRMEVDQTNKPAANTPVVAGGKVFFKTHKDVHEPNVSLHTLEASDTAPDAWNVPGTNNWPVARIRTDPPDADEKTLEGGTTVTLDGSASEGGIQEYEWLVRSDSYDRTGEQIDVTLNACEEIYVRLRVTGPDGRQNVRRVRLSTVE